jgi:hypothetical protein
MGKVISEKKVLLHSQIGFLESSVSVVEGYDVEDMMKGKALSQARLVKWTVEGKRVSVNTPMGPATVPTPYFKNNEELID